VLSEHLHIHQPPPLGPELSIQPPAETLDLIALMALRRKQPVLSGSARIDPVQDVR